MPFSPLAPEVATVVVPVISGGDGGNSGGWCGSGDKDDDAARTWR